LFIDSAKITVKSGNGGNGMVSFHTEKYVPNGGPDGGDGGKGGDVIFYAAERIRTLQDFRYKRKYEADDGEKGKRRKCNGAGAKNLEVELPVGTVIKDAATGRIIADLCEPGQQFVAARGGRGGKGNIHFVNSVRQAPNFARAGEAGEEFELDIELKVLADVGLIGFPNVGKSTLLSVISSAKPKIADYHFTTLQPNLGVVVFKGTSFVVADIPGLIEGASEGAGLGHDFLKHIERTKMFVHVIDVSGSEGRNPLEDYEKINNELKSYDEKLLDRPQIIAANKIDLASDTDVEEFINVMKKNGHEVFPICAPINSGVEKLIARVAEMTEKLPSTILYENIGENVVYEMEKEELFTIEVIDGRYHIKGKWSDNLVESTNFDDTLSIQYFQRILRKKGIIDALEKKGINEGDTVVMHTLEFEFIR